MAMLIVMVSIQPLLAACSLLMSLALGLSISGRHAVARRLSWMLPVILTIVAINSLFSPGYDHGWQIGFLSLSFEGAIYGICMGVMLSNAAMIFLAASDAITTDELISLFRGRSPYISQAISMTFAFMPRLRRCASEVLDADRANTCMLGSCTDHTYADSISHPIGLLKRPLAAARDQSRRISAMLDVSMDDSIRAASSLRARGWGRTKRSTYIKHPLHHGDLLLISMIGVIGILAIIASLASSWDFSFYPKIEWHELVSIPSLAGCAAMVAFTVIGLVRISNVRP